MGMKWKKSVLLAGILILTALLSLAEVRLFAAGGQKKTEQISIVTSFYPMYIAAWNVVDGMEQVELTNLTENHSGCLHDYQLTTEDMRVLENADVFIMNGGGMESFVENIISAYPDLMVIDASGGIAYLDGIAHEHSDEEGHEEEEHDLFHEEDDHVHEEGELHRHSGHNTHVWLNPDNYKVQIENIMEGLAEYDSDNAGTYRRNGDQYIARIENLSQRFKQELYVPAGQKVVTFHAAFAYLAGYLGMDAKIEVDLDEDAGLSAGDIAAVIDEVKADHIELLFTEEQYKDAIVSRIASETGAAVYVLDPLVNGEVSKDAYLNGMSYNLEQIKKALNKNKAG